MATPNYAYEKRQRELAKKKKNEEKRQKKLERGGDAPGEGQSTEPGDTAGLSPSAPPPPPSESA